MPILTGARHCAAGVYYEQGKLDLAVQTYQEAISREPNFPEAYNNLGNALREANRMEEAMQCYTLCIQLQLKGPPTGQAARAAQVAPQAAAYQQAQRLSVAYNNLGGILKMQVTNEPTTSLRKCKDIVTTWMSLLNNQIQMNMVLFFKVSKYGVVYRCCYIFEFGQIWNDLVSMIANGEGWKRIIYRADCDAGPYCKEA